MKPPAPAPDPIDIAVGHRIRFLRREKGITQEGLAVACGVTFQQIQKYERGANRISASMMVRVAAKLGIAPGQLFNDDLIGSGPPDAIGLLGRPGSMELLRAFSGLSRRERQAVLNLVAEMAAEGNAEAPQIR